MKALLPALVLAALAAGPVHAACSYPKAPASIPDGNTATTEEMVAAKQAVESYNKEIDAYLSCIKLEYEGAVSGGGEELTEERKKELERMQVQKHNAAVDELQASRSG